MSDLLFEQVAGYDPIPFPCTEYTSQTGAVSATFNLTNVDAAGKQWAIVVQIGSAVQATCYSDGSPFPPDPSDVTNQTPMLGMYICSYSIEGCDPGVFGFPWSVTPGGGIDCELFNDPVQVVARAQAQAQMILANIPFTGSLTGLSQLAPGAPGQPPGMPGMQPPPGP